MSTVNNTNPLLTTTGTVGTDKMSGSSEVSNKDATLDKDGFLKLFVAQLQHQDPSAPMDANASTQQMATFTQLEQMTNLATTNAKIATTLNTSSAVGLIGRTVTYIDADGASQTGKVEKVATSTDGQASLTIAGKAGIDPSSISEVAA
jgi:flagellar basal-body rod modification protein FlgD